MNDYRRPPALPQVVEGSRCLTLDRHPPDRLQVPALALLCSAFGKAPSTLPALITPALSRAIWTAA